MFVIDVETTGIDPRKNSIVSIGAIDFLNPKNQFYQECKIFKGAEIMSKALEINGFTMQQITDSKKQTLKELIHTFIFWLDKAGSTKLLIGENPSFDRDFINETARRYNIKAPFGKRTIDLHSISYIHHLKNKKEIITDPKRDPGLGLDNTLNYTGLPQEPTPHNALTGAKMEAEAFSRLVFGKNLLEEFKNYPIPAYLK